MIEKAKDILNKRHLLVIGKSEAERRQFVSDLILRANFETFRFPSGMKQYDDYLEYVIKKQLYEPWYEAKRYNINQIIDFHRDWVSDNYSFIIMEEFDSMEERWKIELLRMYLNEVGKRKKGEKKIHLLISQESENNLIEKLSGVIDIRENDRRTARQIVEQNLRIIDLSE